MAVSLCENPRMGNEPHARRLNSQPDCLRLFEFCKKLKGKELTADKRRCAPIDPESAVGIAGVPAIGSCLSRDGAKSRRVHFRSPIGVHRRSSAVFEGLGNTVTRLSNRRTFLLATLRLCVRAERRDQELLKNELSDVAENRSKHEPPRHQGTKHSLCLRVLVVQVLDASGLLDSFFWSP